MKVRFLDGERFRNAFVAGTMALERRREYINSINVFPVPDGDTGDNMVSTCRSIAERTVVSKSIAKTVASMADAALVGARGNSGLIFCQYIHGLAKALERQTAPGAEAFGESLVAAVPFAEHALQKPVEGTILTVMREWAHSVKSLSASVKDFAQLFPLSLEAARKSLLETPRRLEVLAREKVVDAGAQGFVDFLEGISDFLEKGNLKRIFVAQPPLSPQKPDEHFHEEMPEHRYCTEAIVEGDSLTSELLMEMLSSQGESFVIGGGDKKFRIHLHTDNPPELFARLAEKVSLTAQKVDDMRRQVEVKRRGVSPVALVTDSSCDLPHELLDKYGIHMVPLKLSSGGSEYLDKLTIRPDQVYRTLRDSEGGMKTAQPSLSDFASRYAFLADHYDSVISIHLSAALSGTWNTALKAAESVNGKKIRVLDSRNLCAGLGLIVLKAAEAVAEGKSSEEVVRIVEQAIPRTKIFASLSTLRYMVRGGRIPPIAGAVAGFFKLVPIITADEQGKGMHFGKPRTEKGNRRKLLAEFERLVKRHGLWKYAVVHADAPEKAEMLAEDLERICGAPPAYVMTIAPVIGINAGPDSVGVALLLND